MPQFIWRVLFVLFLKVPVLRPMDLLVEASPRRVFANAHAYHINSISINSDCETYLSADDLRINLWNLNITDRSFSILSVHLDSFLKVCICSCGRFGYVRLKCLQNDDKNEDFYLGLVKVWSFVHMSVRYKSSQVPLGALVSSDRLKVLLGGLATLKYPVQAIGVTGMYSGFIALCIWKIHKWV